MQLHPAGAVHNPPAMSPPQQTNVQMQMQGQPFQQPQFYRCTNYPQMQQPGYHLLQQDFSMPLQPTLQQQETDGTSLQSTSHDSFAPSPKRPLQSTSHDSFAPSPKRPLQSTSHDNFAPSPKRPKTSTCELLLLSVDFLFICHGFLH